MPYLENHTSHFFYSLAVSCLSLIISSASALPNDQSAPGASAQAASSCSALEKILTNASTLSKPASKYIRHSPTSASKAAQLERGQPQPPCPARTPRQQRQTHIERVRAGQRSLQSHRLSVYASSTTVTTDSSALIAVAHQLACTPPVANAPHLSQWPAVECSQAPA